MWVNLTKVMLSQVQWFMPIIPASWETEIRKIVVQSQPGKKVIEIPSQQKIVEHGGIHMSSREYGKHK
jgi:agmatine/peptidylarginine deiminase